MAHMLSTRQSPSALYRSCLHRTRRAPLDSPHDIIPLAKEFVPIVQHRLLLLVQIVPLGHTILSLQTRTRQRATRILARENMVRATGLIRLVLGDVEHGAFYGYVGWFIWVRAWTVPSVSNAGRWYCCQLTGQPAGRRLTVTCSQFFL